MLRAEVGQLCVNVDDVWAVNFLNVPGNQNALEERRINFLPFPKGTIFLVVEVSEKLMSYGPPQLFIRVVKLLTHLGTCEMSENQVHHLVKIDLNSEE